MPAIEIQIPENVDPDCRFCRQPVPMFEACVHELRPGWLPSWYAHVDCWRAANGIGLPIPQLRCAYCAQPVRPALAAVHLGQPYHPLGCYGAVFLRTHAPMRGAA